MNRSRFLSRSDSHVNAQVPTDLTDIVIHDSSNEDNETESPKKTPKKLSIHKSHVRSASLNLPFTTTPTSNMPSDMKLIYERKQTQKIIDESELKNITAQKRANLFRCLNLLITFFIILVSLGVGILETQKNEVYYTIVVLNFLISIIGTLHFIFRIGQRGIFFKYASLKYQNLLTVANEALFYSNEPSDLRRINHQFRRELVELSYRSFKMTYGPESELRRGS